MSSTSIEQKDSYAITRKLYSWEAMFEYMCTILASSGFFAKVTVSLGVRDSMTALIGTVASLACVFSILSGHLQRYTPIKKWLLPLALFARLCMVAMYLLPFVKIKNGLDVVLLLLVFGAQAGSAMIVPAKQNMFLCTVREENRTGYLAVVNMVSLVFGIPLILFGGVFLDFMEARGQMKLAFFIIACAILFFCICHMLTLILSKEPPLPTVEKRNLLRDVGSLLKNKKFRFFLITSVVHNIAQGTLAPFLVTYAQRDFEFSMVIFGMFNAIQMLLSFAGFFVLRLFGRRIKPTTLRTIFFVAYLCYDLFWLVMNKETAFAWHFPVVIAGGIVSSASIAYTVLLYAAAEEKDRISALAFSGALMGICTFVTTLCITPLFDVMQANGVSLFGMSMYPQQILAIASIALRLLALVLWLFEKKQYGTIE